MGYNIDLTAALKPVKTDSQNKYSGIQLGASEKSRSFGDSLKDAAKSIGRDDAQNDQRSAQRKDMVSRSESKLKNWSKPQKKASQNIEADELEKTPEDKQDDPLAQLLAKLEQLINLQAQEDASSGKQAQVLDTIKELIAKLSESGINGSTVEKVALQKDLSELQKTMDVMLEQLKADGSIDSAAIKDFETAFNNLAAKRTAEPKELPKALLDNSTKAASEEKTETVYAAVDSDKSLENDSRKAVSDEAEELKLGSVQAGDKAELAKPVTDGDNEVEETDEVKAALDKKMDKSDIQDTEDKKQGTSSDSSAKTAYKTPVKANVNQKLSGEDLNSIRLNQQAIDGQADVEVKQAAPAKTEMISKAEIINQIVKKAEVVITDSKPEMRIQLEPENLGKLSLKLAVEKGLITAKFVAESQEVKAIIESSLNELRDMLQEKGLEVQSFSVSVGQDSKDFNNANAFQQWKETVKLNGRSLEGVRYGDYEASEGTLARQINPYSVHNGQFDYKA